MKKIQKNAYIYELTLNGKNIALEIIQLWNNNHQKAFRELLQDIKILNPK